MQQAVDKLITDYRRIAEERMRGLPICNDRLSVEAVDFRQWEGHTVGVLITPWFINLVLLPEEPAKSSEHAGELQTEWEFPSGRLAFDTCETELAGSYQSAALFSTVSDFPDQDTAREVARAVMTRLFQRTGGQPDPVESKNVAGEHLLEKQMSRRDLFSWLTPSGE